MNHIGKPRNFGASKLEDLQPRSDSTESNRLCSGRQQVLRDNSSCIEVIRRVAKYLVNISIVFTKIPSEHL